MYPSGFTTIAEYLERQGLRVRIVNLAVQMLQTARFDVERCLLRLDAAAFGIDLHWLPHAHGAIEIARLVKRLHPTRPVIFGGFSATYFHQDLLQRPEVDFVVRGDSTEEPMLALMRYLRSGGAAHPQAGGAEARQLAAIPNLVWRDAEQAVVVNPIACVPDNLDHVLLDYSYVLRAVVRYRDLSSFIPFRGWMRYPITAALSVRGCRYNCATCGGSACAYGQLHGRRAPAYRQPEQLADDVRRIGVFSRGPVFLLGDIRQAGDDYAERFLDAIAGYKNQVFLEFFDAPPPGFFARVARALPDFTVEISLESHDDGVRRAFGRPYTTAAIERSMFEALDAGCSRLDLFFMVGLREQTYQSVMDTVDYCARLLALQKGKNDRRLIPFISPLAPFLDPGSRAFEDPDRHGYRLRCRTLEEHRQALLAPSWKHVLNYETRWLSRDGIVAATYEAGRRMNLLKAEHGLVAPDVAEATDQRIALAVQLVAEIDRIMAISDAAQRHERLQAIKPEVDTANLSTVCDKRELELPMPTHGIRLLRSAHVVAKGWLKDKLAAASSEV
jgi:B12-binding domain/radical SAM domain protein